jgi:hypothetical protein
MRPHLLRFDGPTENLASLIRAAGESGLRVGWLELGETPPVASTLEELASCGVLRAVAVGGGRSIAVKPMRGAPVLKDLLREHFRGCALVLVRGSLQIPLLQAETEAWRVVPPDGQPIRWRTEELLAALRRAHPWPGAELE